MTGTATRGIYLSADNGAAPTLTVRSSTIANNGTGDSVGGGIYNEAAQLFDEILRGTIELIDSTVVGNTASSGGGVYNQGRLQLWSSLITINQATGGPGSGGGVLNDGGSVLVDADSSIDGNTPDDCVGC